MSQDTAQLSVQAEESRRGTTDWDAGTSADPAKLAIWASPYEASSGDTMRLFIHSIAGPARLDVYRMGSYGGTGGRLMVSYAGVPPDTQPACSPAFPGPVECPWHTTVRLVIPADWTGGVYFLRVAVDGDQSAWYPFVVRSRRPHALLAVVNQFTWQAYNTFGGSGLYVIDPATNATVPVVSFERPFAASGGRLAFGDRFSGGTSEPSALRWLEKSGYDVGYISDLDLADPTFTPLAGTRALVFLGHDEYWTWNEYSRVEGFRDAGVHLAFLGANNVYWNVRFGAGSQLGLPFTRMTCYKLTADPGATGTQDYTTKFRLSPLKRPENQLVGIEYSSLLPNGASLPFVASADSVRGPEATQFLAAALLAAGDTLGLGTGDEGDQVINNGYGPTNLQVMFVGRMPPGLATNGLLRLIHSSFYIAPSGAGVFATGSNTWASQLDGTGTDVVPNPKVQQVTAAVLNWMLAH